MEIDFEQALENDQKRFDDMDLDADDLSCIFLTLVCDIDEFEKRLKNKHYINSKSMFKQKDMETIKQKNQEQL